MILTPEEIQQLVKEVQSPENVRRKKSEFDLYLTDHNELKPFVKSRVIEMYPQTGHLYTISSYSVTKKVVNKKAKSYKEPPIRTLINDAEGTKKYQEIAKTFKLNASMRELDKMFNRHQHALMAVFMDKSTDENRKETFGFKFIPIEPFKYDLKLNDDGKPVVVILSYTPAEIQSGALDYLGMDLAIAGSERSEGQGKQMFYVFWTDESHFVVRHTEVKDQKGIAIEGGKIEILSVPENEGNENPFGILPFAYIPISGSVNYPPTNPLGEQTIELNALMSIYLTSGSMQTGQLVVKYPSKQPIGSLSQGLFSTFKLPQSDNPEDKTTEAEWISPSPDMAGHRTSIMTYLSMILDEQGLGVNGTLDSGDQSFTSGFDRIIANADVQDAIEDNQECYRDAESQIFSIIRAQLKSESKDPFKDDSELAIKFRKPKMLVTDKEKLENIKLMDELDMIEPWEKLVQFDPNLTEEEAKEKHARIKAAKASAEPKEETDEESDDAPLKDGKPDASKRFGNNKGT